MSKVRLVIQSLIPWVIFFTLDYYGTLEFNIAIVVSLGYIIIFNNKALQTGFILDWASLLFFFAMVVMVLVFNNNWYVINAPVLAYYTLASVFWLSVIIGRPIALQYAKVNVTKELWDRKIFFRINNILTIFWALIITSIAMLNTVEKYVWGAALWLTELLPTTLFLLGIWFMFWFPEWYKRTIIGEWGVINIKNLSALQISHASIANIAFRSLGKGKPIILLPAAQMNMYCWDPELVRILAKNHRVIMLDYPDVGHSRLKRGDYDVTNLANAIAEFIENICGHNASVLGYAMGGWIAQTIAIRQPDLVNNLILIATDVGSPRSTLADKPTRELQHEQQLQILLPNKAGRQFIPKLRAIYTAANLKEHITNSVILLQQHMTEQWYAGEGTYTQLGNIEAQTLVISGSQDRIVNRQNSMLLVNGIRGAQFVEFPDAGHGVIYQHPVDIAEQVNDL